MPGEEYHHVSPGGGQWERVSDVEAAVVFNQRTRGTLQLPAQQVIWEVIKGFLQRDSQTEGKVSLRVFGVLFARLCTNSSFMIIFCKPPCICPCILKEQRAKCAFFWINTEGGSSGRYRVFLCICETYVFVKSSGWMKCVSDSTWWFDSNIY